VRFQASDGVFTDAEFVKIYVGAEDEPTNSAGIPLSLQGWSVDTTNVMATTTGETARVMWSAVPGIVYDVYYSDAPLTETGGVWTVGSTGIVATGTSAEWLDDTLGTNRMRRYYQVVLEGEAANSNGLWGVARSDLSGPDMLLGIPLRHDGRLDGGLGRVLADALTGDVGGPADGVGDELYFLREGGAWVVTYLDAAGVWRDAGGKPSSAALSAGEGMVLMRGSSGVDRVTFTGRVGNDGSREFLVRPGWNLLVLSEGRERSLGGAFDQVLAGGGPVGHAEEASADRIVTRDGEDTYRLFHAAGLGAPYDGNWVDAASMTVPALHLKPGQVIHYYRQPSGGEMRIKY